MKEARTHSVSPWFENPGLFGVGIGFDWAHIHYLCFLLKFSFSFFFWPHLRHMEVSRPGTEYEQLQHRLQLGQHWILNPLHWGQGSNPSHCKDNTGSLTQCATSGTPLVTRSSIETDT